MHLRLTKSGYLAVLLLALWGAAEFRHWKLRERLKGLRLASFQLRAVDSATGSALQPWIGFPASDADHLPVIVSGDATPISRTILLGLDRPIALKVSSEGYGEQWITLDPSSPGDHTVRLQRK